MTTKTIAEYYLAGRGGSVGEYFYGLGHGQRVGQAFFNALSGTDQERLRGTLLDPFHLEGPAAIGCIEKAIEWLLDTEGHGAVR